MPCLGTWGRHLSFVIAKPALLATLQGAHQPAVCMRISKFHAYMISWQNYAVWKQKPYKIIRIQTFATLDKANSDAEMWRLHMVAVKVTTAAWQRLPFCVKVKFTLEQAMRPQRRSRESVPILQRLGGHQDRSELVRKILPSSRFDPRTVQPVASHCTDWSIPTHPLCIV
jgi:hypothetical protein